MTRLPLVESHLSRRELLRRSGLGFGSLALSWLLQDEAKLRAETMGTDLKPRAGHFPAKAKAVIQLFMHGGPSHVDTWERPSNVPAWRQTSKNTSFTSSSATASLRRERLGATRPRSTKAR